MDPSTAAIVFFLLGLAVLAAEVILPSFGLLTVVSLGLMFAGVYNVYQIDPQWGFYSLIVVVAATPILLLLAIRWFPYTPIGKRYVGAIRFQNTGSAHPQADDLTRLVGRRGKAETLLRPVGTCRIDGQRIECRAESGLIEAGSTVEVIAAHGSGLIVRQSAAETAPVA